MKKFFMYLVSLFSKKKRDLQEREHVAAIYLLRQEKMKCSRLEDKLNEEFLDVEAGECLKLLKSKIQEAREQDLVKDLDVPGFLAYFSGKSKKKIGEDSLSLFERLKAIYALKNEMGGKLNMEQYYAIISKFKKCKEEIGPFYLQIKSITKETEALIDKIILENKNEESDFLVKKISLEVKGLMEEKMSIDSLKKREEAYFHLDSKEIQSIMTHFKNLQQKLEGASLREYVQTKQRELV